MRHYVVYILLLTFTNGFAQVPVLYFSNLTTGNGLSNNKVNCIIQDKRGFIWIGTDDGLNRYDGHRFQTFRHNHDTTSISGNIITDILEDKDGLLWISTRDGGLTRYDYRVAPAQQFKQFKHLPSDPSSIPVNIINALEEDADGNLWLATSGQGMLRFEKKSFRFSEPVKRKSRTILALSKDSKGIIWGGREGGGFFKVDPSNLKYYEDERYVDVYAKLPHQTVAALYRDRHDNMWIGSWDKVIYKVNAQTKEEEVFKTSADNFSFAGDDPLTFAEDNKGYLWIGGQYSGLHLFDQQSQRFYQFRHDASREGSLSDDRVNCIYITASGIVWLGTNRGISVHDPAMQQFSQMFLPGQTANTILYDFMSDDNGNLVIGTSEGLFRQNPDGTISYKKLLFKGESLSATKFFKDPVEGLFIGTNVSLFKYNDERLEMLPNTEKDVVMGRIIESRVVSMVTDTIDSHPVLMVAPYGHFMAYYDYATGQWINRRDTVKQILRKFNIKDNLIRKFYKARNGQIWIATVKAGLGEWKSINGEQIKYHSNNPADIHSIGNNNVYDITEDNLGNLWVSTYGGGLYYFRKDKQQFEHIAASHNLAEGIQIDRRGNIWMIANGNLHKYDPYRKLYTTFQLPDIEKTGGVRGYIFKDPNGKMYVAGTRFFISFHPDSIRDVSNQPAVYFTDFKVFNNSNSNLLFEKQIKLQYNENYFSFEFAAPSYQAGYPVQYAHMLEGADKDWVEDGTKNTANYTNLDGGDYTFKVRATVKPGVWGEEIASIKIFIVPPFWKTWWFYAMCALVVALIIYGIYRYRINELLKRQAIRNKIAQDLHDNVGSTLSSISVYSQVAKIYKQKDKQTALQETLEKISVTSSEMISEMNDIVWAINPRNDNMETILQRMESFARPLLASQHIQFHFEYDPGIKQLHLEMTKRKNFYLIFKEAVNNALKYAACKNIWVNIKHRSGELELTVKDDGKGFNPGGIKLASSLSGNGLQNMKVRAKEMKGEWLIESEPEAGTLMKLVFPIP